MNNHTHSAARGRCLWLVAALALLANLVPAPWSHPAPAQAAGAIRWGFYVTYNPNSLVSLQANADQLNYVSPWFYSVNSAGIVTGTAQVDVNTLLRSKNIKNLPMIRNTNGYANFHDALATPATRDGMIAQLHNLVVQNGYDGITIDFEAISPEDAPLITGFMSALFRDFHGMGKLVAQALPAKTIPATTGWAGAFDYPALKPWADYFIIMAYDQHFPGGPPGAIAPLPWLNDVANYTVGALGADKVIWGIGLYGYDWNTSATPRPQAEPRTWAETRALVRQFPVGATDDYDFTAQAPHVTYVNNGVNHDLWYENRQSFEAKISFIQQRGFAGFAVWRLGQEDPGIWTSLAGLRSPCTPVAGFANSADRVYFPQTGHSLGGGFYEYWKVHGGLPIYGYPLTEEFTETSPTDGRPYTVQYFERNRFEFHPELRGTPYIVQLGLLGVQYTAGRQFPTSAPQPPGPEQVYFPQTGHLLRGGFYLLWMRQGGLAQFGYPLSDEFVERSPTDGNNYTVQYFERARFEWHPEYKNTPAEFQLGLLGVWSVQHVCP
jgi:spore germination protein YaaH